MMYVKEKVKPGMLSRVIHIHVCERGRGFRADLIFVELGLCSIGPLQHACMQY